jgi:hypothetical protein
MAKWTEYDPVTGIKETNSYFDGEDTITVHKEQHVQALLDRNAELRATAATDKGIKGGFWWYCSIPLTVQYELLSKYGLNIQNKNHTDAIFDIINRDYPALKVTQKTHSRSRSTSRKRVDLAKPGPSPSIILPT